MTQATQPRKTKPDGQAQQPEAEIAPGVVVRYAPRLCDRNEDGTPNRISRGHLHRVSVAGRLDPGEPLRLRFVIDDRDGPIPQITADKVRRAALDLLRLADFLAGLQPTAYQWKKPAKAKKK